ncbi:MAG: hypothetical protein ACM3QS_14170 [Bacteroidota bacterium]
MDQRLELAAQLLQLNKVQEARILLESIVKDNRHDVAAWQLYAETWTDPVKRKRILESCLRLNPSSPQAQWACAALADRPPERLPASAPETGGAAPSWLEQLSAGPEEPSKGEEMPPLMGSPSGKAASQAWRINSSFWVILVGAALLAAMILGIAFSLSNPVP